MAAKATKSPTATATSATGSRTEEKGQGKKGDAKDQLNSSKLRAYDGAPWVTLDSADYTTAELPSSCHRSIS